MPTIIDVAKEAGVSFKTVSRVFSGEARVRSDTRDRVLKAAHAIGYVPNAAARALRSQSQRRIGLLLDNPSTSYSEAASIGALLAVQGKGAQLAVLQNIDTGDLSSLSGALICSPLCNDMSLLERLEDAGLPYVRIGPGGRGGPGDRIGIDDRGAAREMTDALIRLGHRRIGFITGPSQIGVSTEREAGYRDALSKAGLPVDPSLIAPGDFSYASGLSAAETLLKLPRRPSAIFAANDEMASACLAVAYKRGLRVPDFLSVAGFDNAPVSRVIYPTLSTVRQGTRAIMHAAMAMLEDRLSGARGPARDRKHPHEILLRESTAPPA